MASIENRSRYTVTVKNRDDLTQEFPLSKSKANQAHIAKLREQDFKPKLSQTENLFLVRIRQKGYDVDKVMRNSREEADAHIKKSKKNGTVACSSITQPQHRFAEIP
jgi:predicted transcriptional regulator